MKHRLLIDWLWWLPVVLYGFDMVPTKVELTGTITNIIDSYKFNKFAGRSKSAITSIIDSCKFYKFGLPF